MGSGVQRSGLLLDMQDDFRFAVPAVHWQIFRSRAGQHSQEVTIPVTPGTCQPAIVPWDYSTVFRCYSQAFSPHLLFCP
jgi:hypothetical protein